MRVYQPKQEPYFIKCEKHKIAIESPTESAVNQLLCILFNKCVQSPKPSPDDWNNIDPYPYKFITKIITNRLPNKFDSCQPLELQLKFVEPEWIIGNSLKTLSSCCMELSAVSFTE